MKNFKSTKRALLTSVLSLALCFTMLLGTTFAWFTDSVTSANNIIKSGNLDIELKYWNGTAWVDVAGKSDILTNKLWEPGVTEVAYLRVANAGSLALKYQLGVNIVSETDGVNAAGEPFKLSDYIMFGVVEGINGETGAFANRDAAVAAVNSAKKISAGYTKSSAMKSGEELYLALVVYMPTTVGNVANHNGENVPQIDLGINVIATQLASEEDSFGKDYDKDAWVEGFKVYNAEDLQAAINAGEDVVLMGGIELTESLVIPADAELTLNLNGKTLSSTVGRDADNNRIHTIVNNGTLTLVNGIVASAGENGGSAVYNAADAVLTIEDATLNGAPQSGSTWPSYTVNNYGTMTVTDSYIYGVQGIIATNDTASTTVNNVTAYRDGWSTGHVFYTSSTAKVTINGGTYTNDCNGVDGTMFTGGETVVNGGTFVIEEGAYFSLGSSLKLTVNGGDFTDVKSCLAWGGTMTVKGGAFGFNPNSYVAEGYEAKQNTDGSYSVVIKGETLTDSVQVPNAEVYVPAGTYTFPSNVAEGVVINCAPGAVFTGTTGLNLPGATVIGGTFANDSGYAVSGTINGTFKNCTFEASEALRWCYTSAGEKVVFENCTFKTDFRGIHFDGMNGDVKFINCEINGFNAYSGTGTMTFVGCTFGNDESNYNGLNIYTDTVITDCTFNFVSGKTNFIDMEGTGKTLTINNCTATLDGEEANVLDFVGGSKLDQNTLIVDGAYVVTSTDTLVSAINAGQKNIYLAAGEYALRFTNHVNFNLNETKLVGADGVKMSISSSEGWYGRVQGSNVTFENIHFTSSVGATGKATYNNCTFDSWAICASSNKEETIFDNCTIKGCLNTSTDFSSGDVFVKNCEIAKAEYSGSMTMNFVDCQIGEIIIWNANTNLTNCKVTKLDDSNVTTATVTIK